MHGLSDAKLPALEVKTATLWPLVAASLPRGQYHLGIDDELSATHLRPLRHPSLGFVRIDVFCRLTVAACKQWVMGSQTTSNLSPQSLQI
jgi:hypothetical protein